MYKSIEKGAIYNYIRDVQFFTSGLIKRKDVFEFEKSIIKYDYSHMLIYSMPRAICGGIILGNLDAL